MPEEPKPTQDNSSQPSNNVDYSPAQDEAVLRNTSLSTIESESANDIVKNDEATKTQQTAPQTDAEKTPFVVPIQPPSKKKKGLIIGIILAALLALLSVGGVLGYMWYQNPEKVVLDAIINAAQSKTSIVKATANIEGEGNSITVNLDTKGGVEPGSAAKASLAMKLKDMPAIDLEGEGIYASNGDVYFRANNLVKTYDSLVASFVDQAVKSAAKEGQRITNAQKNQLRSTYDTMFKPIITKVDSKWIKISVADMKEFNKDAGDEYDCTQKVLKKLTTDKEFGNQLRDVYAKNRMFTIKESGDNKGDSVGYSIKVDKEKAKQFNKEIKNLSIYKELMACSKTPDSSDSSNADTDSGFGEDADIKLWIDKWNHSLTEFNISGSNGKEQKTTGSIEGTAQFNQPVTVTPPSTSITLKELQKELEGIMPPASPSSSASDRSETDSEV